MHPTLALGPAPGPVIDRPPPPPGPPSGGPALRLPGTIAALLAVMVGLALVRELLPRVYAQDILVTLGLALFINGEFRWDRLYTTITAVFVHADWLHLFFNAFWIATIGSLVHRVLGSQRFLLLFFGSALAGSLAQIVLQWGVTFISIGASGAVFGLIGAIGHVLVAKPWEPAGQRLRKLVVFTVLMMALNLAYAFAGRMPGVEDVPIAWEAHAAGFFAGLLLFPLLARGRWPIPV